MSLSFNNSELATGSKISNFLKKTKTIYTNHDLNYRISWLHEIGSTKFANTWHSRYSNISIFKVNIMFVQLLGVIHFCDIFNIWLKPLSSQDAHTVYKHSETAAGVPRSHLVTINREAVLNSRYIFLTMCKKVCLTLKFLL